MPIVLTYLDIAGIAEPIRLALTIGEIPFEDRRVSYAQIAELRAAGKLPSGQVPTLEIDGVLYGQSAALLRWAGRKAGLYPDDLQLSIDGAEGVVADIKAALSPQWYKNALSRNPATGDTVPGAALSLDQQRAVEQALNEDILPARFAQLESLLASSGGPYVCGKVLTIADLSIYVLAKGLLSGVGAESDYCQGVTPTVLDNAPQVRALVAAVAEHPRVAAWNKAARA